MIFLFCSLMFSMLQTFNQLSLYPTLGEMFIFPIKKLGIPVSSNYSINNGWKIIQPYIQETQKYDEQIISVAVGNINGDQNSITNIFAVLTNQSVYLNDLRNKSTQKVLSYDSSLQCFDLSITGLSHTMIVSCLNNSAITLLQNSNNTLIQIPLNKQFQISNATLVSSSITYTLSGYVLCYNFNKFYQSWLFIFDQNIIEYQGQFEYQSITTFISYIGSTFILSPQYLYVNGMIAVQAQNNSFINMTFLTLNYYLQEYLIFILQYDQIQIYMSNQESQLLYIRSIRLQRTYSCIQVTQNYIYLINNKSIDTFTYQDFQLELYSTIPISWNQFYSIQNFNILFVANQNILSILKYQDSYILTNNASATQNLSISGYDNNNNYFQNQIQSIPISYNDTQIYLVEKNQIIQSQFPQYFVNVQNQSVGPNQTFTLQNQINGTQLFHKIQQNASIIFQKNTLIDLFYSVIDQIWIQVLYNNDNYQFTISQLQLNFETLKLETVTQNTYPNSFNNSAIELQIITIQNKLFLLLSGSNFTQIYQFNLSSIEYIQQITLIQNETVGTIKQIEVVQDKIYFYYSNFNNIYQYQYLNYALTGPYVIDFTCNQATIYSNQVSFPQTLFISCEGNIYILKQTFGVLGYYMTKNIPITYNAILAPIQNGLYVYEYNTTFSQLYFIHLLDDIVITKVCTYGLQLDNNITYSYSDYFFYVQEVSQTGEIYESIYQGEYMQQSSQYYSTQAQPINSGIFQQLEYDLVYRYGEEIYIDYIPHFTVLEIIPQFNYQYQINLTSQYIINNAFNSMDNTINTVFSFDELKIENNQPSIVEEMKNLTYSNRSQLGYKFEVPKYLSGIIQNYNVSCVNCSNFTYYQPLEQQYVLALQQAQQILNYKDNMYILVSFNEVILYNPQQKLNQSIFSDSSVVCQSLFIELYSQNVCWVCQNLITLISYLYQYNQQTTYITSTILGQIYNGYLLQTHYLAPVLQIIFQPNIYFLYYFTNILNQITLKELISNQVLPIQDQSQTLPISYQSSSDIYYFGILTYQSNNRLYFFISQLYIYNNIAVLIQINQFTISDPLFDFYSPTNQFCGGIISQETLNYTIFQLILCGYDPLVLQITMNQLEIQNFQILCTINQLNYTNTKFQYNQVNYVNNLITTVVFNTQNQQLNLYLYYINESICQNRNVLQPIQYMTIQNQTNKYSSIQTINNNSVAVLLDSYIYFYSIQEYLLTLYQPKANINQVMLVIKASNPSSESVSYVSLVINQVETSHWVLYTIIGGVVFLVIIALVFIIFWRKHKKQKEEKDMQELQENQVNYINFR